KRRRIGTLTRPPPSSAAAATGEPFIWALGAFIAAPLPLTMWAGSAQYPGYEGRPPDSEDRIMTLKTSFKGSFTALVTPFSSGSLDEKAFRRLVDWQIAERTAGLVPGGTAA